MHVHTDRQTHTHIFISDAYRLYYVSIYISPLVVTVYTVTHSVECIDLDVEQMLSAHNNVPHPNAKHNPRGHVRL